jgi:transposase
MNGNAETASLAAIVCADWGKEAGKRAVFVADFISRAVRRLSRRDWSVNTVLAEAERWKSRGTVLVTFDAPLGVPESYLAAAAKLHGWPAPANFVDLLECVRSTPAFFHGTTTADDWTVERPFFAVPSGKGGLTGYRLAAERYEYVPAHMLVIEDVCRKYACSCTVRTASKPPLPIAKSTAGASLLAQVIVSKMADHLPLHRQAKIFRRHGVEIADQTMCGWMAQSAALIEPLYGRLKKFVLASKVVGTDDTPVKVLDRSLPKTRKGRIWPYTGDRDHPAVVYDYTRTRERAGPEEFLKDYRGYLQADAYAAYDSFFTKPERGMTEVACWAHTRRHFHKALDSDPSRMRTVLLLVAQLYRVEKTGRERGMAGDELRLLREHGARPTLQKLHEYLREIEVEVLPKSPAGQAVAYALKNWTALTRYCDDPDLAIDNNHTERSLRGFAVGRNNWTFFGSDRGGRTAAILRSFVSSCELVKIDPFLWFRDVLSRIGEHPVNRLDELLPHRWVLATQ